MLEEEKSLIKRGEEWRSQGKRIPVESAWLRDGNSKFLKDIVEGRMDTNVKLSNSSLQIEESMQRLKIADENINEEQGERLVNSKTKGSPSNSPENKKKTVIQQQYSGITNKLT